MSRLFLASFAAASLFTSAPAAASPLDGTWDLTWQTRHGPSRSGFLVIREKGGRVEAEVHGQGALRVSGTAQGNRFALHGSRMLVPYTLSGTQSGDRIDGLLKVMSVERRFTGTRRR